MEAEGSEVQSQPLLHSKFQASLDYVRSCQERKESKPKEAEGWESRGEEKEGKTKNLLVLTILTTEQWRRAAYQQGQSASTRQGKWNLTYAQP